MAHRLPSSLLRRSRLPHFHHQHRSFHTTPIHNASHASAPTTSEAWSRVLTESRPALSVGGTVTFLITAAGLGFAYLGQAEKVVERSKAVPKRIYFELNPLITGDPNTVPRSVVKKVEEADVEASRISAETGRTPSPLRIDARQLPSDGDDDDDDDHSLSSLVGSALDALSDSLSLSSSSSSSSGEASDDEPQGAYNPETGEINWGCPCLGGMAFGPCGEEFKAAFSCFVFSEDEPKGMGCLEQFQGMQDCFRRHPDHYREELEDDRRAEEEAEREQEVRREHEERDREERKEK